jgi:hypothetical protein
MFSRLVGRATTDRTTYTAMNMTHAHGPRPPIQRSAAFIHCAVGSSHTVAMTAARANPMSNRRLREKSPLPPAAVGSGATGACASRRAGSDGSSGAGTTAGDEITDDMVTVLRTGVGVPGRGNPTNAPRGSR